MVFARFRVSLRRAKTRKFHEKRAIGHEKRAIGHEKREKREVSYKNGLAASYRHEKHANFAGAKTMHASVPGLGVFTGPNQRECRLAVLPFLHCMGASHSLGQFDRSTLVNLWHWCLYLIDTMAGD